MIDKIERLADRYLSEPASLDVPIGDPEGPTLASFLSDDGAGAVEIVRVSQLAQVCDAAAALDARQRAILALRYGTGAGDWTVQEIGGALGISSARVSQIEADAIRALRVGLGVEKPPRLCECGVEIADDVTACDRCARVQEKFFKPRPRARRLDLATVTP